MVATSFAAQAEAELREVENDPRARLEYAQAFFHHTAEEHVENYAGSEVAFMEWEVRRGCLNALDDPDHPGSVWWRSVNGSLLRDAREAHLLFDAGHTSTSGSASNPSVVLWQEFLERPSARTFYRAHNRSVAAGYVEFTATAGDERGHEQKLMNLVLYRVLFTHAVVEQQPWAFGWVSRFLARWVGPTSPMVKYVVHRRDLYPTSYPLSKQDCDRLDRNINHLGNLLVSLVDLIVICYKLPRLYDFAATELDVPELRSMCRHFMPCYPWGMRLHPNEMEAIEGTDRPSLLVRAAGWALHGAVRT